MLSISAGLSFDERGGTNPIHINPAVNENFVCLQRDQGLGIIRLLILLSYHIGGIDKSPCSEKSTESRRILGIQPIEIGT